jgi:hypothetical protein
MIFRSLAVLCCAAGLSAMAAAQPLQAITFADAPKKAFVPIRELAAHLELPVGWREDDRKVTLNTKAVPAQALRKAWDGKTTLVDIKALGGHGLTAEPFDDGSGYWITTELGQFEVVIPEQWVEISIADQRLVAGQGSRIVMETHISSGKRGHSTPRGSFTAGPIKQVRKFSSIYNNAPMPYSVQVKGNIFIHGSGSVPRYPASAGCIRMPLTGRNAAKWFYNWVSLGAPIRVLSDFTSEIEALRQQALPDATD